MYVAHSLSSKNSSTGGQQMKRNANVKNKTESLNPVVK